MLYFVIMADTEAKSAKRKKKAERDSDRARAKHLVNLGQSWNRWREMQDLKLILSIILSKKHYQK